MEDKTLFELVNTPFTISFAGKEYTVRQASLEKAIIYRTRLRELVDKSDPAMDLKLAAFCLYLVLSEADSSITEEFVLKNAPANFDPTVWVEKLGFMTPQRKVEVKK